MPFQNKDKNRADEFKERSLFKVLLTDKIATFFIYSGGILTIVAVIGILAFVLWEALPLVTKTSWNKSGEFNSQKFSKQPHPILTGIDEYKEIVYVLNDAGEFVFIDKKNNSLIKTVLPNSLSGKKITAFSKSINDNYLGLGTEDGYITTVFVAYNITFDENSKRKIEPKIEVIDYFLADSSHSPIKKTVFRFPNHDLRTLFYQTNSGKMYLKSFFTEKNFLTEEETTVSLTAEIPFQNPEEISTVTIDESADKLIFGTYSGKLLFYSISDKAAPLFVQISDLSDSPVTALNFILGDRTVIAGTKKGELKTLTVVQDADSKFGWQLSDFKKFYGHQAEITSIASSSRNKSFLTGDKNGNVFLFHLTTGVGILDLSGSTESGVSDISFAPKADGAVVLYDKGIVSDFEIDNKHPEFTFSAVFGKVLYEGYKKPEYVWQSTGGTDDFEPKFSLMPLLSGTLKGTFFAMIFAIPLALLGAIYTALFMNPRLRKILKPTIEMMATLPSVVIGFLAGIWLAPVLGNYLSSVILMLLVTPVLLFVVLFIFNNINKPENIFFKQGNELIFIIPVLILSAYISANFGTDFENMFFGGDFRIWLQTNFNIQYEQRNGIVVGFALGFAVIPIIYTICEDSLSNVPESLKSAAYSLGADKWQTAWRVIIPTASPGILSAIMIGFGRAIGETMIVLMATGNTPITDWNIFNGMRTLAANIAIEISEAPVEGTLYRILFLSASLLFVLTFFINTIADIVRQKLRNKYINL